MSLRKDFFWGAATASYQIEGAWNEDGKGSNIWDEFTHRPGKISDNSTGDVACDSYHLYKDDVKLMSELGLKAYRFSISWARILPHGTGEINQKGIEYYNNLINELLKYNITPFITIYHWDLPYELYLRGGWLNPECRQWFEEYTKVVAENFGDRVKNFITFNEPSVFMGCGYEVGVHAPGLQLGTKDILLIGHNILVAHGKAVKVLREKVADVNIGITLATQPKIPLDPKDEDGAYDSYFWSGLGGFYWSTNYWMDPITTGKYPEQLVKEAGNLFPKVTEEEMDDISQKIDFLGLNIYEAQYHGDYHRTPGTAHTELSWDVYPDALKWGLKHNYRRYKLPIFITENGMSAHDWVSLDGKVHDPNRIDFLHRYLRGLKEAAEGGVDVRGYFQWSFMDNFEWARGYNPRFGLVHIDYKTLKRVPKDSAFWYKTVIESNGENL
ncbi:GH1 family beta-glucosidase [Treponema sp.]|uniref:GH1 family beta-glucosidase n=1 Tax=Treponema sp. TaxID=166 RepID=UPI00298EC6A1|nr:GH1 family beta-glucosidase [Treponema sp.]MCQ2242331.1 GH1 family beta-glucosidase [Treponema sp.]